MWTRKELKEKGRIAMRRNYWKTVLVSLILVLVVGGANFSGSFARRGAADESTEVSEETLNGSPDGMDPSGAASVGDAQAISDDDIDTWLSVTMENLNGFRGALTGVGMTALIVGILLLFLVLFAVFMALHAFLLNPLEVGIARFFLRNLNNPAEVKEVAYHYDHSYLNAVKTVFLKNIYIFLWAFVFIIPAIIKAYEYRMVNYILADNPEMSSKEVLLRSRAMMKGNKWKAFVLDLSFLGWFILSLITLGLVGVFYAMPYKNMTNAALYEYLEYGKNEGEVVVWTES